MEPAKSTANTTDVKDIEAIDAYFSVKDLAVSFDDTPIVNGLSLSLSKGEIGCLLGFSGCGKTTALRAIAGLEEVQAGTIRLDGKILTQVNNKKNSHFKKFVAPANRNMGMVFQDYALFGHLTVAKNIAFGLNKLNKQDKAKRVQQMLELTQLTAHAHKKPHQLSGGQQQRVALARALAPKPKLLLLDEPFSNLDVVLRESLAANVRDVLKQTETTAILVTHDQHEAFAIADKIGIIHQGVIEQWAKPSDLYHLPSNPFVADFIGEGAMIEGIINNKQLHTSLGDIYKVHEPTGYGDTGLTCDFYNYPDNTKLKVLIRPDDVVHDDHSEMTALVIGRVFRGANYLYQLQLDDGQIVYSLIPSHHDHELGTHIGIKANLEHVVLYEQISN
ncbi:ABC transporter ATP-binding protein [Psychrobacter sp. HD31]|uniref:ABC transporter ATP-binding protein n=1 Tax=Psychrobacter sp. HD31 TaxID=3112003 RepID=UPI003DA57C83